MAGPDFFIVDVFAEEKYAGNQLAVFLGAKSLSDEEMQLIAREMNYSETTFILSGDEKKGFDMAIFTPGQRESSSSAPRPAGPKII